jgi:glycosyltransferase involved in cell wall biosynthesis
MFSGGAATDSLEATHYRRVNDPVSAQVSVAVLLPCRNEETSIGTVVRDFRKALPGATVYVYDNASSDRTADVARTAGAVVRYAPEPGKGNVLRRMFAEVDATAYVLADGDDTYDATAAPILVRRLLDEELDMVVGTRVEAERAAEAYRPGHRLGNRLLTRSVHVLFGNGSQDMLSGYRVFSRRYVKSFPATSRGFETETEMTVHALELSLPFAEVPTEYKDRPAGSTSKLRTIPDGFRILKFILMLCKDYKPLRFFGTLALLSGLLGVASGLLPGASVHAWSYPAEIGLAGLMFLFLLAGIILDSLGRSSREMKRMLYLAVPRVGLSPSGRSQGLLDLTA